MKPIFLKNVRSVNDLAHSLNTYANNQLAVVVVSASWCNPCKVLKNEIFNESSGTGMSSYYINKDIRFFYIDVDESRDIVENFFKVNSVPSVFFMTAYQEGDEIECKQIDSMSGGNKEKLKQKLESLLEI